VLHPRRSRERVVDDEAVVGPTVLTTHRPLLHGVDGPVVLSASRRKGCANLMADLIKADTGDLSSLLPINIHGIDVTYVFSSIVCTGRVGGERGGTRRGGAGTCINMLFTCQRDLFSDQSQLNPCV